MKNKDKAFIEYIFCLMVILVISLLIVFSFKRRQVEVRKQKIEDAITEAALASAIIDLNEFGTYNYIRSNDGSGHGTKPGISKEWSKGETKIVETFRKTLMTNLNLMQDPSGGVDNFVPAAENSLIKEARITKIQIYDRELAAADEWGNTAQVKDYQGRWVDPHHETDKWVCYTYNPNVSMDAQSAGVIIAPEADGNVYTPWDKNIISQVGDSVTIFNATDGSGAGHALVDNMTIYAQIEFVLDPFGNGINWQLYSDEAIPENGNILVKKSVVVAVENKGLNE